MNGDPAPGILGNIVIGIVRHFVGAGGSALVAHGYMTGAQDQQAVGAVMVLFTIGLSVWDKMQAAQAQANAVSSAVIQARLNQRNPQ